MHCTVVGFLKELDAFDPQVVGRVAVSRQADIEPSRAASAASTDTFILHGEKLDGGAASPPAPQARRYVTVGPKRKALKVPSRLLLPALVARGASAATVAGNEQKVVDPGN